VVGNIPLGIHQKISRQPDNPFIRPATGSRRQFRNRHRRDVCANNGKITVVEFPNIRTPVATGALRSVGVRIGAESFLEHART
jgi:hypothetical protein